jgi:hypothetical protein
LVADAGAWQENVCPMDGDEVFRNSGLPFSRSAGVILLVSGVVAADATDPAVMPANGTAASDVSAATPNNAVR